MCKPNTCFRDIANKARVKLRKIVVQTGKNKSRYYINSRFNIFVFKYL